MPTQMRKHDIADWDAVDVDTWNYGGAKIARRNLISSVVAEHVGFSVWSIWSVMVLFMPQNVYHIDDAGKFLLIAMPTLVGAFLRLPYTFATATFGGRNWTIFSALILLVPTLLTVYVMAHPGTSYTTFMVVAALAGVGGGNFASSTTNINAFFPQRHKGWALGLNAGDGNIGVSVIQVVGLLVIATVGNSSPPWVCAVYLVFIGFAALGAALGAALFTDNLTNQLTNRQSMVEAVRDRDRDGRWQITVLCEEPTPAYDRVALSSYVGSWDRTELALPGNDYATDEFVELRTGGRARAIDRDARVVTPSTGDRTGYDALVLATGSYPFVPPVAWQRLRPLLRVSDAGRPLCDPRRRHARVRRNFQVIYEQANAHGQRCKPPAAIWPVPIAPSAPAGRNTDRWRPVAASSPAVRNRPPVRTRQPSTICYRQSTPAGGAGAVISHQ
jgi:hypothetical protein